jgi:hypothetical protein
MNEKRLRSLARRHRAGQPSITCAHPEEPALCDAVELAVEVARLRAWADFAEDLLDAHIWGFGPGDWQAADALAHALSGSDWPPTWRRDLDDAAHIIVDESLWPTSGKPTMSKSGKVLTDAYYDWAAQVAERGFDPTTLKICKSPEDED